MSEPIRCLMAISVLKVTGDELGKLKDLQLTARHSLKYLPDYCVRSDNRIGRTEDYLQFIFEGNDEYTLFDIDHIENPLAEEFNEFGTGWKLDFSFIKNLPNARNFAQRDCLFGNDYLLFSITYTGGDSWADDYDYDTEVDLIGYLDAEKSIVRLEN